MRHDGLMNALAWFAAAGAVSGAVAFASRDPDPGKPLPPGHEASTCRACRANRASGAHPLPYELSDDTVRLINPAPDARSGAGLATR